MKRRKLKTTKSFHALAAGAKQLSEEHKRELTATIVREIMVAARSRIKQVEELLGVEFKIDTTVIMSENDPRQLSISLSKATTEVQE